MLLSCRRWSSPQPTAAGKGPAKPPPTQGGLIMPVFGRRALFWALGMRSPHSATLGGGAGSPGFS